MPPSAAHVSTLDDLLATLARDGIARVTTDAWSSLMDAFVEIERHATAVAGDLVIVRTAAGPAAVETPSDHEVVVRRLADPDAVRQFVAHRLAQYERMWEGCGCRIDYYG